MKGPNSMNDMKHDARSAGPSARTSRERVQDYRTNLRGNGLKRAEIVIPVELNAAVQKLAQSEDCSVTDALSAFAQLGYQAYISASQGAVAAASSQPVTPTVAGEEDRTRDRANPTSPIANFLRTRAKNGPP